jgi:YHS domain-containing protein
VTRWRDRVATTSDARGSGPVSGSLPSGDAPIVSQGELGNPPGERRAAEAPIAEAFETDPVCGSRVNVHDAERREYNGHVYYFDSTACRSRFDATPKRFTTSLDHRRSV